MVVGALQALFRIEPGTLWSDPKPDAGWPDLDFSPDPTRFLAIIPQPANRSPLTAVVNGIGEVRVAEEHQLSARRSSANRQGAPDRLIEARSLDAKRHP
jgi:hypothetical protein